ncbi:hypothetical protein LR48_Vigan09g094500 [Vigna angularis]|uniref:Uncharacterized protein n=1 Tax=Phaseolus angularis TaxID=3914 RepID=A0A0L9VB42_PHAAN|nr:hypothetical protein LR48_Vigan09g094500 [Vigna angularis]
MDDREYLTKNSVGRSSSQQHGTLVQRLEGDARPALRVGRSSNERVQPSSNERVQRSSIGRSLRSSSQQQWTLVHQKSWTFVHEADARGCLQMRTFGHQFELNARPD